MAMFNSYVKLPEGSSWIDPPTWHGLSQVILNQCSAEDLTEVPQGIKQMVGCPDMWNQHPWGWSQIPVTFWSFRHGFSLSCTVDLQNPWGPQAGFAGFSRKCSCSPTQNRGWVMQCTSADGCLVQLQPIVTQGLPRPITFGPLKDPAGVHRNMPSLSQHFFTYMCVYIYIFKIWFAKFSEHNRIYYNGICIYVNRL